MLRWYYSDTRYDTEELYQDTLVVMASFNSFWKVRQRTKADPAEEGTQDHII